MRILRTIAARLSGEPMVSAPATRLSAQEAAAIAEATASRAGHPSTHGHAMLIGKDDARVWRVEQVSIGSGWVVEVDDATGEAGPVTRWGLR